MRMLQRYEMRRKIWAVDVFDILKCWTSQRGDILAEKFIPASSVGGALQESDVPLVRRQDQDMYVVNTETAASWVWALAEHLSKANDSLESIDSAIRERHQQLNGDTLDKLPSLALRLYNAQTIWQRDLQKEVSLRDQQIHEEIQALDPELASGKVLSLGKDTFPLGYIRMLVAWHTAVHLFTSHNVLLTGRPLQFALIRIPHPDGDMESVEDVINDEFLASVMQRFFPPGVHVSDIAKETILKNLRYAIPQIKSFRGSVHCEAILMAIKAMSNSGIAPSGIDMSAKMAIFQVRHKLPSCMHDPTRSKTLTMSSVLLRNAVGAAIGWVRSFLCQCRNVSSYRAPMV
ncbi:hypothetical protein BKA93DRAFT_326652 [Sparassis latifolia]